MGRARLLGRPFALCAAANFTQELSFHLFVHLPAHLERLGAGEAEIGWIWSIAAIAGLLCRIPIGRVMDARGRRIVFVLGGLLNAVACPLYLTAHAIGPWIYVIRLVHGLAGAMLFTALFTYAADHTPAERRTEGLALFGATGMLALAFGGTLGDAILSRLAFSALFVTAAVLALVSLAISLALREGPRAPARGPGRVLAVIGQAGLLPLWWLAVVVAAALEALFAFTKIFIEATGYGSAGGFFGAYALAAITLRLVFGSLPDRIGPRRVLLPALVSLAAGFAMLAWARDTTDVIVAGTRCGLGHGYVFPIVFGLVITRASAAARGAAVASCVAFFDVGALIGGPVFGHLAENQGHADMFRAAALSVIASGAIFMIWDRRRAVAREPQDPAAGDVRAEEGEESPRGSPPGRSA